MSDHPNDPLKYHKHPEWLAAIKTDWHDPTLTVRQIGERNNVHFTRPGQLSVLYGWEPRKRGPKPVVKLKEAVTVKVRGEDGQLSERVVHR